MINDSLINDSQSMITTDQRFSLISMFLSPPSSICKINKYILGWRLKKKKTKTKTQTIKKLLKLKIYKTVYSSFNSPSPYTSPLHWTNSHAYFQRQPPPMVVKGQEEEGSAQPPCKTMWNVSLDDNLHAHIKKVLPSRAQWQGKGRL